MALLKIRRPSLKLFGRVFQRGETIESRDYPADQHKWAQLIDHRLVDLVDKPGGEPLVVDGMSREEIVSAVAVLPEEGRRICADCDFVANTPHGLKVHVGRAHKKE